MTKPIVSDRCAPPTAAQIAAMEHARDTVLYPAVREAAALLGDGVGMVLDLLLSVYVCLGVGAEGAARFAETLAEVTRTVVPTLPAMEAEARAAGRA